MYYINVNGKTIAKNARSGTNEPPISVRKSKSGKGEYCHEVEVTRGRLVYSPTKPILKCGARLVLQTPDQPKIVR